MKYLSIQTFQCGISVSGLATFTGGAEINILSLNGATTSSEASLFLGAHGTNEGGQLVLQKGTSNTYAAHLDNYADQFRLLYGTNTGSTGVALAVSLSTRQLILPAYTSTSSFSGTAVGYLAFDSAGNVITVASPSGAVTSIIAGTGVSVSSATGNVTISIGQSVATSAQVTFDSVITNNNGNGTNIKLGDDAWIGDVNASNTFRVTGAQNGANGYIIFGNANSDALGRSGTGNLTYAGSTVWTAATLTDLSQLTNGPGYITSAALSGYVPTSRTLTINGTSYDLSADRTWTINTVDYTSRLQHQVKAGVAINKGQAVYVTSADGTNMIVGLASNASEATSSKTMGLLDATVSTNGFANVVTEGLLAGLDTTAAGAEGDPVWLGTGGNLIYGLANKPYAPAHLVFIGIVTRKNANNGEIFVKVQNGFELREIHDVDLITTVPVNGHILGFDGTLWVNKTIAGWLGYTPANASGTTNYISKFTGSTTLGNSQIFDNGTNVGIGTASPVSKLHVIGNISLDRSRYIFFGGEGSTGEYIYEPTPGTIAIHSGGSDSMVFPNTGIVYTPLPFGIGTNSPSQLLHIVGTNAANNGITLQNTNASGNSQIRFLNTSGTERAAITYVNGSDAVYHYTAGGGNLLNLVGANVGIGTGSPNQKLSVEGGSIQLNANNVAANYYLYLNKKSGQDGGILFNRDNANDWQLTNGAGNGDLVFYSYGTSTEAITFKRNTGNVGIGTTTPYEKLEVNGAISATGAVNGTSAQGHSTTLAVQSGTSFLYAVDWGAEFKPISVQAKTISLETGTGSTTSRLFIDNSGNVGIGTTSPSQKLDVNGYAKFTSGIILDGGATSHYREFIWNTSGFNRWDLYVHGAEPGSNVGGDLFLARYADNGAYLANTVTFQRSTGNVGINTTSPYSKLEITSSSVAWGEGIVINPASGYSAIFYRLEGAQGSNYTGTWAVGKAFSGDGGGELLQVVKNGLTGSAAYRVDASQQWKTNGDSIFGFNVGIGTTNPLGKLHIADDGPNALRIGDTQVSTIGETNDGGYPGMKIVPYNSNIHIGISSTNDNKINLWHGGSNYTYWQQLSTYSVISNYSTNALVFQVNGGSVGIGTTSPAAKLDVNGETLFRNRITINSTAPQTYAQLNVWDTTTGSGASRIADFTNGTDNNLNIYISQVGASSKYSELASYSSNPLVLNYTTGGNVGIGTTSPSQLLHVAGNIRVTGAFYDSNNQAGSAGQILKSTGSGTDWVSLSEITGVDGSGTANYVTKWSDADTVTNSLIYDNGTNVGIGTTSPGYNFDVNGQVRVQDKLRVGTVNSGNGVVHMSSSATINPNTTTIVWAQNVSVGMCAFIEYYILNNNSLTDQRAGTIMVTWNQSGTPTIAHTETTTPDIGSTTSINFTSSLVGSDARINAVNSSANPYTIVMSYKYF